MILVSQEALAIPALKACSGNVTSMNNKVLQGEGPAGLIDAEHIEFCQMLPIHPSPRKLWAWCKLA